MQHCAAVPRAHMLAPYLGKYGANTIACISCRGAHSIPVRLQVVQEIKVLRSNISAREREKAERATLVQQDKLIKAKVGRAC